MSINLNSFKEKKLGKGALIDPLDTRDRVYDGLALGSPEVDWEKGYDIEKEIGFIIPFKNQDGSSSCVGQGWAYYGAVLNAIDTGTYSDFSAKAIYSQIGLPDGGAYIRDGAKLFVNWGSLLEENVSSYENGNPPSEPFMKDFSWKNDKMDALAKRFRAQEYRTIVACDNMDLFAIAIRDNHGVVGGVKGENNGTWMTNEPKPPVGTQTWGHCLFFGKFGIDKLGRYIATPNSWGTRANDELHPDGWQKLREDYFNSSFMFNPWTIVDIPNYTLNPGVMAILKNNEKGLITEGEGVGRKGIVINGKLREVTKDRVADACWYMLSNKGFGQTISTKDFEDLPKDNNF